MRCAIYTRVSKAKVQTTDNFEGLAEMRRIFETETVGNPGDKIALERGIRQCLATGLQAHGDAGGGAISGLTPVGALGSLLSISADTRSGIIPTQSCRAALR